MLIWELLKINIALNIGATITLQPMNRLSTISTISLVWIGCSTLGGEEVLRTYDLGSFPVFGLRQANDLPAGGFSQLVSHLRFEPQVDLQTRGPAESQSDITVRGGNFEQTGFRLGALNIMDPQTGHYAGELPVDPDMLSAPMIRTGVANALAGFNSNVATLDYRLQPIVRSGVMEAGVGTNGTHFQRYRQSWWLAASETQVVGAEISIAHSSSDGTLDFGDHRFLRLSGRLQRQSHLGQTDLIFGYVDKFYGWPGMYTGNRALLETDDYQVYLIGLNHRMEYGPGSVVEAGVYYRRLRNDYELDRLRPGFFRPYEHATEVGGFGVHGTHVLSSVWALHYRGNWITDNIVRSTELKTGTERFSSRRLLSILLLPEYTVFADEQRRWTAAIGAGYDNDNRESAQWLPQLRTAYQFDTGRFQHTGYLEMSTHSQVTGYTALNSNPGPGAFAGNPDLVRESTRNFEAGWQISAANWTVQTALFHRRDRDLADWTFSDPGPGARIFRQANPVDLNSTGVELIAHYRWQQLSATLGYLWLTRSADYQGAQVDASYYAGNFARQRATLNLTWRMTSRLELLLDQELRQQEPNRLRQSADTAYRASFGVAWHPTALNGLELRAIADNLTQSNFEPFPGTPGEGRQVTLSAAYRW